LTKQKIDVAEMLIAGYSYKAISDALGVSESTIRKWLKSDEAFKELMFDLVAIVTDEIRIELVAASRAALRTLGELLQSSDEKIRLKAAQDILDRAGFNAKMKQEVDINNTYSYFTNLSDDELLRFIRLGMGEVVDSAEPSTS